MNFTKFNDRAMVINADACSAVDRITEEADIIFMDPPYVEHAEVKVLQFLANWKYLDEDAVIVVECDLEADFDFVEGIGLEVYKIKEYKTCQHVFIRRK